jgi:hypothetical protein
LKFCTPKTDEEIKAAAEKREHEKFVYATNQALNKLSEGIVSLALQHERMFAKHQSLHNNLGIAFENHVNEVSLKIGKTFTCLDDFRADLGQIQTEVKDELSANRFHVTKDDLERFSSYIVQQQKLLDMSFTNLKGFVESKLSSIKGYVDDQISSTRNDLKPNYTRQDELRDWFEEKLKAFYVDFAGLVKEIAIMKEAIKYGDKKFENLYTLIERLKKGAP